MSKLSGKIVVITGASSGIGRSTALEFAKLEAKAIILVARNKERLSQVSSEIDEKSESMIFGCDISNKSEVLEMAKEVLSVYDTVDILVNNAGTIFKITPAKVYTVLRHLTQSTDGSNPKGSLVQHSNGNFYGMTSAGGTNNLGTIFKITSNGTYTVLRNFTMATDGGNPFGSLMLAPVNNLVANPLSITTDEDVKKAFMMSGSGGMGWIGILA